MPESAPARPRRRALPPAVAGTAAVAVLAIVPAAADATQRFASRPDLRPTGTRVQVAAAPSVAPGYVFTAPKAGKDDPGPMIVDNAGRLVFFKEIKGGGAYDFRAQTYKGHPVLTWWQGTVKRGYGEGEGVIYDSSYRQIASVKAGNGQKMDLHEFNLTPEGTALVIAYKIVRGDTRGVKRGRKNDLVMQNVVQEIDVASGRVLLEWDANKSVAPAESYDIPPLDPKLPYDYIHLNSVNVDSDGNLLISGRATHAVYKIDRKTGALIWKLGGKRSSFRMGPGTKTPYHHDVHRLADGTITLFDNHADAPAKATRGSRTRGVQIAVDEQAKTARLVRQWYRPTPQLSASQGNAQTLPNGNLLMGFGGSQPFVTEFARSGRVLFDLRYDGKKMDSYRAYRFEWTGTPTVPPKAVARKSGKSTAIRVSWNGATAVARWQVLGGPEADQLQPRQTRPKTGFETLLRYGTNDAVVQVQALAADGKVLGTSRTVRVGKDW